MGLLFKTTIEEEVENAVSDRRVNPTDDLYPVIGKVDELARALSRFELSELAMYKEVIDDKFDVACTRLIAVSIASVPLNIANAVGFFKDWLAIAVPIITIIACLLAIWSVHKLRVKAKAVSLAIDADMYDHAVRDDLEYVYVDDYEYELEHEYRYAC